MQSLSISSVVFLGLSSLALAQQTPPPPQTGQVEQSLERKRNPKEETPKALPKIEVQPRPEMTSEDDTKVRLQVELLRITGAKSNSVQELYKIAGFPGGEVHKELTLAELKKAASRITTLYRDQGFTLAWAYVPAQDVKAGVVEIAVVEGRIDKVLVTGNNHYSAEFIMDHVERLQKESTLSMDSLERSLLVLNQYPGLSVHSTLRQGDSPGTTDMYVDVEDRFPIGFSMDFDNFGPKATGEDRLGATLTAFNLFDAGHWVTLRGVTSLDRNDGATTNGRLDYFMPFKDGTRLDAYASYYEYEARGPVAPIEPAGNGDIFGLVLSHPLILNHELSVTASLGFEYKNLEQDLLGVENAKDRLRTLDAGVVFEYSDDYDGRWVISGDVLQGLGQFLGGLKENDPEASRLGADDSFTRLNGTLFRLQKITSWVSLIGKAQGQYAFQQLVVPEQFALGGADSVRGYAPFEYMGDRGYTVTLESRFSLPFLDSVKDPFNEKRSIWEMIQIAGFIDNGEASRIDPQPGERRRLVLTGAGGGLRLNYPNILSIRFDVAKPISSYESSSGRDTWYYVSVILNLN